MRTLRYLGFAINYKKLQGPCQVLTFLGIEIDFPSVVLGLPADKLDSFINDVQELHQAQSATKKELQSLVGKLSWACQVVQGGRPHLHHIFDCIHTLKGPRHRTRI